MWNYTSFPRQTLAHCFWTWDLFVYSCILPSMLYFFQLLLKWPLKKIRNSRTFLSKCFQTANCLDAWYSGHLPLRGLLSGFASCSRWIKHRESLSAGSIIHRLPRLEKTLKDRLLPPPVTKYDDTYNDFLQKEGGSCHQSTQISRLSLHDPVSG